MKLGLILPGCFKKSVFLEKRINFSDINISDLLLRLTEFLFYFYALTNKIYLIIYSTM